MSDCKNDSNNIILNNDKPWIHVPEGYVGRYRQNITSNHDQFIGLCTTQFTLCWPIIIIHKKPNLNSPIDLSLIHFADDSQPLLVKLEIDHIIGNNEQNKFICDNCHIFIVRQLSHKNLWQTQKRKQMLLKMIMYAYPTNPSQANYTIVDLPKEVETGFIGIKFADFSHIQNTENINELNKYLILLSRAKRDLSIQQNPFFLIRHPQEYHLRIFNEISPISLELRVRLELTEINDIPVIFDDSHWVNIDDTICFAKADKFIKKYKSYPYSTLFEEICILVSNAFPTAKMKLSQNQLHLRITAIIFYMHLWNNNLKELTIQRIKHIRVLLKNKTFVSELNEMYQIKKPYLITNKLISDALTELSIIVEDNENELLHYSEKIFKLSTDVPLNF
eukprot:195824_1